MALNLLTLPQLTVPAAAVSVTLTSPGSDWGNSAYAELDASVNASILSGFVVKVTTVTGAVDVEVDIAVGAAAAEVPISTVRFGEQSNTTCNSTFRLPIGIDAIPNGSRLSARVRSSTTAVSVNSVAITIYETPVPISWLTTTQPVVTLPPATAAILLTAHATAWLSGNYVELRPGSGSALVFLALITYYPPTGSSDYEVDVATGAGGAESVVTTIPCHSEAAGNAPGWSILANPLDNIGASVRVALRLRSSGAGGQQVRAAAMVIEKPLLVAAAFASFGTGV